MLKKLSNWPTLLGHFFCQNSAREFVWGEWDCAIMAADAVKVMTGHDYAEALRFQYSDAKGAHKLIKPYQDLTGLIQHLTSFTVIDRRMTKRGDLVIVENQGRQCAGIVWGSGVFATGDNGLVLLPLSAVLTAWSI